MAWIADTLVVLALLAGALVFDPSSADPLSPKLPLALLLGAPGLIACVLAAPGLALAGADLCVMAGFALVCAQACLCGSPLAAGPVVVTGLVVSGAWLSGRACGARGRALTAGARLSVALLAVFSVALAGRFQRPAGVRLDEGVLAQTLVGPLTNPDYLAGWLVVTLPLVAVGKRGRVALLVGAGLLATTLSRGAWLAAGVSALAFYATGARAPRTRLFALAAVAVVLMGMALPAAEDRAKLTSASTLVKRLETWSRAASLAAARPLTGHGPGRFADLYGRTRPAGWESLGIPAAAEHVHCLPLELAVDYGLPGLALAALLCAWFARAYARAPVDEVTRGLACGLAAFALHNLVSLTAYVLPVLALAALAAGALATRVSPAVAWTRHGRAHALLAAAVLALAHVSMSPWALSQHRALHEAGAIERALTANDAKAARAHALAAAREATSDPRVRYLVAAGLAENHHAAAALAQYLVLGATDPHFGQQGYNRARMLIELARPRAALAELERFLAREPRFFPAHHAKAEALWMAGERARALTALKEARAVAGSPELSRELDRLEDALARETGAGR